MQYLKTTLLLITLLSCSLCLKLRHIAESTHEAIKIYKDLKYSKLYSAIFYKISEDQNHIVVDQTFKPDTPYNEIIDSLPQNECRYLVIDFAFIDVDGSNIKRLIFINWLPDTAKVRPKMLYNSSKDTFTKKLVGLTFYMMAGDTSEITYEYTLNKILRK